MTRLVHRVDGRLRLRVSHIKNNARSATSLEALLKSINGVTEVSTNAVTGSVAIEYDPWRLTERDLLDLFGIDPLYLSPSSQSTNDSMGTILLRQCVKATIEVALWR